jgi:hypothetical protein
MDIAEIKSLKWGGVYVLRCKGLHTDDALENLRREAHRQAERLGVQFIILDDNIEVADIEQLCEAPQFAAAVERIVRRCLAEGG